MTETALRFMPPPFLNEPYADEWTAPFWEACQQQRLVIPRCTSCGRTRMPPTRFCPQCRKQGFEFAPISGRGVVFTFIVVRHALYPGMEEYVPYVPAAIDAEGGGPARFVSNVVNCDPEDVRIGMDVKVVWHEVNKSFFLPLWEPA